MAMTTIKEILVDKLTRIRRRIVITESVCEECGFDFCVRNDLKPYAELDDAMKAIVTEGMIRHRAIHSPAERKLVEESELSHTEIS